MPNFSLFFTSHTPLPPSTSPAPSQPSQLENPILSSLSYNHSPYNISTPPLIHHPPHSLQILQPYYNS